MDQKRSKNIVLGVIGGSGVYQMQGAQLVKEHVVTTPFGDPSDAVIETKIADKSVFFLPRHGRGHKKCPSEVNYAANIYALKLMGVTHILAVSACGIMKESIKPGDMVIPDQMFDRTLGHRRSTFFGNGIVGHVMFADPFCEELSGWILNAANKASKEASITIHKGGTYVCIEGPQFSTRAESHFYRKTMDPSVIGMTGATEAKLAREAEICYGMLALATDYDCWHETEEDVSVEAVMAVVRANAENANTIIRHLVKLLPRESSSANLWSAEYAIMTDRKVIPKETLNKVSLLYSQYLFNK